MTEQRFLSSIFCDDVRREEGNKLSYMGVYGGNLLVPTFPITLPKLCIAVQMRTSPSPPKGLVFKLLRDDELIAETEIAAAALRGIQPAEDPSEIATQTIGTIFQIFPLQLTGPCKFRARAICDGRDYQGGTLVVDQLRVAVDGAVTRTKRMLTPVEIAAVIAATKNAVDIFDKISGQIKSVLRKQPKEPEGGVDRWRYKVGAEGQQIVVKQEGRTIQTLTRSELETSLTPEHLDHIKVYEASLAKYYKRWQQLYPKKDASADELVNIKLEEQLTDQIKKMKEDLVGIVDFLRSIGVHLDDHYMEVRNLVEHVDAAG